MSCAARASAVTVSGEALHKLKDHAVLRGPWFTSRHWQWRQINLRRLGDASIDVSECRDVSTVARSQDTAGSSRVWRSYSSLWFCLAFILLLHFSDMQRSASNLY